MADFAGRFRQLPNTLRHLLSHPLNRGRPVTALARFALWQVSSRLAPGPVVLDLANGAKILASPGAVGATGAAYVGLHEFADMALVLHVLSPADLFIDVGANVGSYSLLAASCGARVQAFEPVPETFERLQANLRLNGFAERVKAINAAVGAAESALLMTIDKDTENRVAGEGETGILRELPVVTLDRQLKGESPTLIKIDVEGYETEVLAGATELLDRAPPIAIIAEVNSSGRHYGGTESGVLDFLRKRGFRPHDYLPFQRQLVPIAGVSQTSNNTVFVRDLSELRARIALAPRFSVMGRFF